MKELSIGDRVEVIDDSLSIFKERIGDTGVVIGFNPVTRWYVIMFDEGSGDNGWGFYGGAYPEACHLGILDHGYFYEERGKNLPAEILGVRPKSTKQIIWIN